MSEETGRIRHIEILEPEEGLPEYLRKERRQALDDLVRIGNFSPRNDNHGPYEVTLAVEEARLVIRMRNARAAELSALVLSLKPYRRLIQDYFLMLESYERARLTETGEKLEAIDMGRRGLHNEGATLLMERLGNHVEMDFETARKFFTLICMLHKTNLRLVG